MPELVNLSLHDFTASLASQEPAPGGGSASAAAGAAGAALLEMVLRLTEGKEKYAAVWPELSAFRPRLEEARWKLLELVDEDTRAYDAIVAARKLPKATPEEKDARQKALDAATIVATTVPMQTAFFAHQALAAAPAILEKGNPNTASDAFVAALLLSSAVDGALANVRINLPGIKDAEIATGYREDADELQKKAVALLESVRTLARKKELLK
jgi:formiminotetrahydrofolate cyclodeaminase